MKVNVTRDMVLNMSRTLSNAYGSSQGAALEIISEMFNYKNWDTFSAALGPVPSAKANEKVAKKWEKYGWVQVPVKLKNTFKLYLSASGSDNLDASYGVVDAVDALLVTIHELQTTVLSKGLESAAAFLYFDFDTDGRYDLVAHRIVVDDSQFWFEAFAKHQAGAVSTCPVSIASFYEAIAGASMTELAWASGDLFACDTEGAKEFANTLSDNEVLILSDDDIEAMPS